MAKKPPTLTTDGSGEAAADLLLEEFVREGIAWYRANVPAGALSDEALRAKVLEAARGLEFDQLENLAPGRALLLTLGGKRARAGALLEEHYAEQSLVTKGKQATNRSRAGNDAQAQARIAGLPDDHPLRNARDISERDRLIRERAVDLRKAHPNLKPADIKRRLADWARMSQKQIGRVLNPPAE